MLVSGFKSRWDGTELLFGDNNFGLFRLAINHQLLPDVMDSRSTGFFTDFFQYLNSCSTVVTKYFDLDQLVGLEADFNFFQDLFRQAVITNHHHRMQIVTKATQKANLFGIQF